MITVIKSLYLGFGLRILPNLDVFVGCSVLGDVGFVDVVVFSG